MSTHDAGAAAGAIADDGLGGGTRSGGATANSTSDGTGTGYDR